MQRSVWKGALAAAALVLAATLSGCEDDAPATPSRVRSGFVADGAKVYFSFKDPRYDDRGPGFYTYPLVVERQKQRRNALPDDGTADLSNQTVNLDTRTGFFDITQFDVIDGGPNVVFEITTARPIPRFRDDTSSEAKGWFLQLMDIYIDKDHKPGSGRTRAIPGRNVEFTPDNGWEQLILVTPQVSFDVRRLIDQITWDLDFVKLRKEIFIPDQVFVEGFRFRVFVPKAQIGEPQPHWGYQCMMMLFNPNNLEYGHFQNGEVKRFAGNNIFGGADEYNGHPNVIDVLAPTAEDQYKWLSDFVSVSNQADNRYAFLPMLYPDAQPSATRVARRGDAGGQEPRKKVARVEPRRQAVARREQPRRDEAYAARAKARQELLREPARAASRIVEAGEIEDRAQMAARLRAGGLPEDPYLAEVPGQRARRRPSRRAAPQRSYPEDEGGPLLAAPRPAARAIRRARIEDDVVAATRITGRSGYDELGEVDAAPVRPAPRRVARAPADIDAAGADELFSNTGTAVDVRPRPVRPRRNPDDDYGDGD